MLPPRLLYLAQNVARITHAPPGASAYPPDRPWLSQVLLPPALQRAPIPAEEAHIHLQVEQGCVRALAPSGELFFAEAAPPQFGLRRRRLVFDFDIPKTAIQAGLQRISDGARLSLRITPREVFYGWGERFDAFARQEGVVELRRTRDAIAMLQGRESYSAFPLFFSSRGWACLLLNSYPGRFEIKPEQGVMQIELDGPGVDYLLFYGPSFKRILQAYTALTGRPPLPPRWAFGMWVTSYPQGPQEEVVAHARQHRQRDIPLDLTILDYHWEERFHNFRWRPSLVPEPDRLIAELEALGVRLGLITTPFVNNRQRPLQKWLLNRLAHNLPPGLEGDDERALPEYEDARRQGLLAHAAANWWFGRGGMLDFSNPAACAWWAAKWRPLLRQGVSLIKNDDGEYLPPDARSALGMDGAEHHNLYGFFYGRATYNAFLPAMQSDQETPEVRPRPLIYARSVWAGSQRYPAVFLGDQKPTFEGMRKALRAGLSLSLQGFAYWGADVFGLDGKTTPETHLRHAQWALLNPIARYFWRPAHIDATRLPWSHGPQVEESFRKLAALRYNLLPYFYALAWQAYQSGLPILRPLALEFQDDPRLAQVDDQFMLGEALLVAPVLEAGATRRHVVLPAGAWYDFWSGQRWQGPGEIEMAAPPERLPLLARGGSLLPLGPSLQHIPDGHRFDRLWLHAWPPYPARFTLYDDDGASLAYQNGLYRLVEAQVSAQGGAQGEALHARLGAAQTGAQGSFAGAPQEITVTWVLHGCPPARQVRLDEAACQDWQYLPDLEQIQVTVNYHPERDSVCAIVK
jgi:alpha-glucosidase (family GH31 glycosyl hydrolase)